MEGVGELAISCETVISNFTAQKELVAGGKSSQMIIASHNAQNILLLKYQFDMKSDVILLNVSCSFISQELIIVT